MADSMPTGDELAFEGARARKMTLDQIEANYPHLKPFVDKARQEESAGKKPSEKKSRGSGPSSPARTKIPTFR